jgi:hypothetical protein
MPNKFIGKYLSFKFAGQKSDLTGVVLSYNDNYTLIRNFVDYNPDGYYIFKNEKVDYYYGEDEKFAAKVLTAKRYAASKEPLIPLDSLEAILTHIGKKHKLLALHKKKGTFNVVRYIGQEGNLYIFDGLTTRAKWRFKLKLRERECRFIHFNNDYLNSLKLVTKF